MNWCSYLKVLVFNKKCIFCYNNFFKLCNFSFFMKKISLYSAGGLFNASERMHNSKLEKNLKSVASLDGIGLKITLPQRVALNRFISSEEGFDVEGIVSDCMSDAAGHDFILCNLDGPDADSGTSAEYGIALGQYIAFSKLSQKIKCKYSFHLPKIITYRTDFRTSPEKEVGVNAMLKAEGTAHIYYPCFAIELEQLDEFYLGLANEIVGEIKKQI